MDTPQWKFYLDGMSRFKEIDITFDVYRTLESTTPVLLAEALKSSAPLLERLSIMSNPIPLRFTTIQESHITTKMCCLTLCGPLETRLDSVI